MERVVVISMAVVSLIGGMSTTAALRYRKSNDKGGYGAPPWTIRTPVLSMISVCSVSLAFTLAGIWMITLAVTGQSVLRVSPEPLICWAIGIPAVTFFGVLSLYGIGIIILAPQHAFMSISTDGHAISIRRGFDRTISIPWDSIVDIASNGTVSSEISAQANIDFEDSSTGSPDRVSLPQIGLGVSVELFVEVLRHIKNGHSGN